VKEKTVCEEFNKFMKKTRITIHKISASSSVMRYKIVIHLFEKFIIKDEEQ